MFAKIFIAKPMIVAKQKDNDKLWTHQLTKMSFGTSHNARSDILFSVASYTSNYISLVSGTRPRSIHQIHCKMMDLSVNDVFIYLCD